MTKRDDSGSIKGAGGGQFPEGETAFSSSPVKGIIIVDDPCWCKNNIGNIGKFITRTGIARGIDTSAFKNNEEFGIDGEGKFVKMTSVQKTIVNGKEITVREDGDILSLEIDDKIVYQYDLNAGHGLFKSCSPSSHPRAYMGKSSRTVEIDQLAKMMMNLKSEIGLLSWEIRLNHENISCYATFEFCGEEKTACHGLTRDSFLDAPEIAIGEIYYGLRSIILGA